MSSKLKSKFLFWIDVPLDEETSGGLHGKGLAEIFSKIGFVSVISFSKRRVSTFFHQKNFPDLRNYVPRKLRCLHFLILFFEAIRFLYALIVVCIANEEEVDDVIFLQSQMSLYTAFFLQIKGKDPIIVIWDPMEWWISGVGITGFSKKIIIGLRDKVLNKSSKVITASKYMSEFYFKKGISAQVHDFYYYPAINNFDFTTPDGGERIRIALAGQLYAIDAIRPFLQALNSFSSSIEFHVFGSNNNEVTEIFPAVHFHPWQNQKDLFSSLSKMDFLYCPYSFKKDMVEVMTVSFPSKLITYASLGKPVIAHGPSYSSVSRFLKENDYGLLCETVDHPVLYKFISDVMSMTKVDRQNLGNKIKAIYEGNFAPEVQSERLLDWLGAR